MNLSVQNDRAAWLSGPCAKCSVPPERRERVWRLVLLGAPGVGKGTQAELLCEKLGEACHLSTGDVFRTAAGSGKQAMTPALTEALQYMRSGQLVPDSTVWQMVRERAGCLGCLGGFVLDGFPRTLSQAKNLQQLMKEQGLDLDGVLNYELPVEEIVSRLSGRRVCDKCKAVYHVTRRPPLVEGICDHCGIPLTHREDDRPESVKVRLDAYERTSAALIVFYRNLGKLITVSADGSAEQILARSLAALEQSVAGGRPRA